MVETAKAKKLDLNFYLRTDLCQLAQELLGKYLMTKVDNEITGGMIVETEAYNGVEDKACHAYNNKKTKRTQVMYSEGGVAYVYRCHIYHMLNIITNQEGIAHCILIRAVQPSDGIEIIKNRHGGQTNLQKLGSGPGLLTQALGITVDKFNGQSLLRDLIWIEDRGEAIKQEQIQCGTRVGIGYAGEDKKLPWRYSIKGNKHVSKSKGIADQEINKEVISKQTSISSLNQFAYNGAQSQQSDNKSVDSSSDIQQNNGEEQKESVTSQKNKKRQLSKDIQKEEEREQDLVEISDQSNKKQTKSTKVQNIEGKKKRINRKK